MKIAFFSAYLESYETKRYFETAKRLGHEIVHIPFQTLKIAMSAEGAISLEVLSNIDNYTNENMSKGLGYRMVSKEDDLSQFDIVILRGGNRSGELLRSKIKSIIVDFYNMLGIPVLNGKSHKYDIGNKLGQHILFARNNVPIVPTRWIMSEEILDEGTRDMTWPIFVKEEIGSHGSRTAAPQNVAELKTAFLNAITPAYTLIQKKLESRSDIRAIVVGKEVLGGMKRTAQKDSHISNFSAGGSIELIDLTEDEKKLALDAAKALDADYGGADIMKDAQGNNYILEFNRNASFKGFESVTKVDVPEKVFSFLESQIK
jgi:RimK family alpha-L-glutamate ligase